jgi:Flp pilus assembly pilin Flp
MKYITCDSDRRTTRAIECTFVAAGINVTILVVINGLGTILNGAFLSVSPFLESVLLRFC